MAQRRHILATLAAGGLFAPSILRAQSGAPSPNPRPPLQTPHATIPEAMSADGRFGSFIELLSRGGGLATLRSGGHYTVFAPTDAGIDTIPANIRADLDPTPTNTNTSGGANQVALGALINLHIVEGIYPVESFTQPATMLRSRNGTMLKVERTAQNTLRVILADNAGPGVGGVNIPRPATILMPSVMAGNGVILPIDTALLK